MAPDQIVATISINPIIARCFTEGTAVDPGLSQSILVRIFRDALQKMYPSTHVSIGLHDSDHEKLRVIVPSGAHFTRRRVRDVFTEVLARENWLISL